MVPDKVALECVQHDLRERAKEWGRTIANAGVSESDTMGCIAGVLAALTAECALAHPLARRLDRQAFEKFAGAAYDAKVDELVMPVEAVIAALGVRQ